MLKIDIAALSEVGQRNQNEDDLRFGGSESLWFAVLSDGAGGHQGGAIASDVTVRVLALQLQTAATHSPQGLHNAALEAHAAVRELQHSRSGRERMHATVVALWIDAAEEQAAWTHVGDSRLYLLRHGQICHVTRDDSVIQQLVDAGYVTPEQARSHPHRNQLLCAIGVDHAITPNTIDTAQPIQDGDAFLLASDGWWDAIDGDAIETTLAMARSAEDWLGQMEQIVRQADDPGQDNYSAVAVWVGDPAQATRFDNL